MPKHRNFVYCVRFLNDKQQTIHRVVSVIETSKARALVKARQRASWEIDQEYRRPIAWDNKVPADYLTLQRVDDLDGE